MKKIIYILSIILFTNLNAYTMDDYDYYTEACKRGDFVSCSHLAIIYEQARLVPQNMKKAEKLYAKACGGDYAFACHNMAVIYSKNDNPAIKKISIKFYQKACDGGYPESCIFLGRLYRDGMKVPQDFDRAKEEFAKACELNSRHGCKEERMLEQLEKAGY